MKRQDKFVAVDCETLEWAGVSRPGDPAGAPAIRYRTVMRGGGGLPAVFMTEYEPHHVEPRHRHPEDEVLSIFSGELEVDGKTHRAPAVLFVGRGTLYGPLTAGPDGAGFFRVAYTQAMLAGPAEA
ncbi:hypothetical protein [Phenylobacterium sp.]|jgi:hypothetical protein|uniref:hypothetical protein n=1 Tax=Phenylobacterium sp. TaxID=1871053 RepID=UPI002F3E335D